MYLKLLSIDYNNKFKVLIVSVNMFFCFFFHSYQSRQIMFSFFFFIPSRVRFNSTAFSLIANGCPFSRASPWIHVFPRLALATCLLCDCCDWPDPIYLVSLFQQTFLNVSPFYLQYQNKFLWQEKISTNFRWHVTCYLDFSNDSKNLLLEFPWICFLKYPILPLP